MCGALQELRHQADYDPNVRFQHNFVVTRIDEAGQALAALQRVPKAGQLNYATLAPGMTRRWGYRDFVDTRLEIKR